jgi:hypothetical protein
MGILLFLSKSAASTGLDWSEIFLLIFGLMVAIGVLGESTKSEKWKKWHRTFEMLVIIGVAGELFADGTIFVFSRHLQTISDSELSAATIKAGDAKTSADTAAQDASRANSFAEQAEGHARAANDKADRFRLQIAQANERAAEAGKAAEDDKLARVKIEEKLSGWQLDSEGQKRLLTALKPYAKTTYDLAVNPSEFKFMRVLDTALSAAGWTWQKPKPPGSNSANGVLFEALFAARAGLDFRSGLFIQIAESRKDDLGQAAAALVVGLRKEGIPAQGNILLNPDADPSAIHIIIGSRE